MADSRRAWAGALFAACAGPAPRRLIVEVLEGLKKGDKVVQRPPKEIS